MKNDNDLILERRRGVTMRKGRWEDKFHPQNPNRPEANDNEAREPFIPPAACKHPNSCHRHGQCMYVGCQAGASRER